MRFSAIVPAHNSASTLAACLGAIRAAGGAAIEIVVVDDCSSDDSARVAQTLSDVTVPAAVRLGASGARNLGARHAAGEILVFIDADVVAPLHAFSVLQELFAASDVQAVQGVYDGRCPFGNVASQYKDLYYHYAWTRRVKNRRLVSAASFFFAIRREVFETLGGFDERIRVPTVEDADLGSRLVHRGGTILLEPRLQVTHHRHYGVKELLRYDVRLAAAKTRFILRSRGAGGHESADASRPGVAVSTARASEMWSWVAVLALLPFGLCAAAVGAWAWAMGALCLCAVLQASFFRFVSRSKGLPVAAGCAVLMFADVLAIDAGIVVGTLSFAAGRRY